MRSIIFAVFFVACSEARPGYDYSNSGSNLISTQTSHSNGISSGLFSNNQFQSTGSLGTSSSFGAISTVGHHHHQQPIITKHFYIHSAPEEAGEIVHKEIVVGAPRKNYRVVFIKAPSSQGSARISVVPAANEDKTVIYVLSKKADAADIQANVQASTNVHTKPEVFFIKYKTQEEALHAQRQIQAQYDALGGSSHVSDEGVAPVTSVIGQFGGHVGGHGGGHVVGGHVGGHLQTGTNLGAIATDVSDGYLPPSRK